MKNRLKLFLLLIITFNHINAQRIDAPSISEWKRPKKLKLPPKYKFNSVSVYLMNTNRLPDLFTGKSLDKKVRKKIKLNKNDYPKYIYLYIEVPNPKNKEQKFKVPLYLLDGTKKGDIIYSGINQGNVLDEITDKELGFKSLNATGKITTIKGNSTNDFINNILSISLDLFETAAFLPNTPFAKDKIGESIKTGGLFFKNIAKEKKVTSEFQIPIIIKDDFLRYELNSVSIHQIKWDFTNKVYDPLQSFHGKTISFEEIKSSLDEKHPYLIITRYKSYYVLPENYIKTLKIDQKYVNSRDDNLHNFTGEEYKMEEEIIKNIKEAIALKQDVNIYQRQKEKSESDFNAITRIINSYYLITNSYKNQIDKYSSNNLKNYFNNNYKEAYKLLFEDLSKLLEGELVYSKLLVETFFKFKNTDYNNILNYNFCDHTKSLYYLKNLMQVQKNSNKSLSNLKSLPFYTQYNKLIEDIENELYVKAFYIEEKVSKENKISKLKRLMSNPGYSCCKICQTEANFVITKTNQDSENLKKKKLLKMKRNYIQVIQHWGSIIDTTNSELIEKYSIRPDEDLTSIQRKLKEKYYEYLEDIKTASKSYFDIGQVNIEELNFEKLNTTLNKFILIQKSVKRSVDYLKSGNIININYSYEN